MHHLKGTFFFCIRAALLLRKKRKKTWYSTTAMFSLAFVFLSPFMYSLDFRTAFESSSRWYLP